MSETALGIEDILSLLAADIADGRLSQEEKHTLVGALQHLEPREEDLRRLRNRAFDLVRERLSDPAQLALLKWLEGVIRSLDGQRAPSEKIAQKATFSPGTGCLHTIQRCLREARQRIDICVFTLSDDRIAEEVLAAHRRGIAIRIVTDNDKEYDAGSDISRLRDAGIAVAVDRTDAHMHHKFAIFDGTSLLNGSYNWTRSAGQYNEENLVLSNDPQLLGDFAARFEKLWDQLSD